MSRLRLTPHGKSVAKELEKPGVNSVREAERRIRRRRENRQDSPYKHTPHGPDDIRNDTSQ